MTKDKPIKPSEHVRVCPYLVWELCQCRAQVSLETSCLPHHQRAGSETDTKISERHFYVFQNITGFKWPTLLSISRIGREKVKDVKRGATKTKLACYSKIAISQGDVNVFCFHSNLYNCTTGTVRVSQSFM